MKFTGCGGIGSNPEVRANNLTTGQQNIFLWRGDCGGFNGKLNLVVGLSGGFAPGDLVEFVRGTWSAGFHPCPGPHPTLTVPPDDTGLLSPSTFNYAGSCVPSGIGVDVRQYPDTAAQFTVSTSTQAGGSFAILLVGTDNGCALAGPVDLCDAVPWLSVSLSQAGFGDTGFVDLPALPQGLAYFFQWVWPDANAPSGWCSSDTARIEVVCGL